MDNKNLTYKELVEISYQALDLYPNLKSFLEKDASFDYIQSAIEFDMETNPYNKKELFNFMSQYPEVFSKDLELFNYITDYEFIEYCEKRFPDIIWRCEFIEKYWISEVK